MATIFLIGFVIIGLGCLAAAAAMARAQALLFADNFEKTDLQRIWHSSQGVEPFWKIEGHKGMRYLRGKGRAFINAAGQAWDDYSFQIRVRRQRGSFELSFRVNPEGRYYAGYSENSRKFYLRKDQPWGTTIDLAEAPAELDAGTWHLVNIVSRGGDISVFIDKAKKLDFSDARPFLSGGIQFIVLDDSEADFRDVKLIRA